MATLFICTETNCVNNSVEYRNPLDIDVIECGGCGNEISGEHFDALPEPESWITDDFIRRQERNELLSASDLKMLPDVPWDTTAWATYRQALRDLPADPAWPDVEFPTPPEA